MELYPGANILVATEKDFEMKNRKLLCSKIATGDYDAVIIGHSQLLKIPLSYERRKQYIREDIHQIENALQDMNERYLDDGQRYSVKQLEKTKKNYEARLEKLTDNEVDDVVTFEELGVDRIYIDEAHMFKNLYMPTKMSNVAGIQMTEAKKSSDLYYKCKYLDEITGGKGVVFATGTPVSNSMTELQSAYLSEKYSLEDKLLKIYPQRKADAEKYIANTAIDAESYKQYSEEFTEMTINGVTFTDKKEAANALLHTIRTVGSTDLPKIGIYKGYDMKVSFDGAYGVYYVTMVGKARYTWQVGQDPLGNLTRMENTLKSIGNVHEKAMHDLEVINRDIATANEFVHTPWAREKELSEKSARLRGVDRLIAEAEKNGQQYEQNVDSEEEQEM